MFNQNLIKHNGIVLKLKWNSMNETKDQKVFLVEADVTESQIAVKNIEAQATF